MTNKATPEVVAALANPVRLKLLYEIINKRTSRRVQLPEGVFDMTTAVHGVFEE